MCWLLVSGEKSGRERHVQTEKMHTYQQSLFFHFLFSLFGRLAEDESGCAESYFSVARWTGCGGEGEDA